MALKRYAFIRVDRDALKSLNERLERINNQDLKKIGVQNTYDRFARLHTTSINRSSSAGLSVSRFAAGGSVPPTQAVGASPLPSCMKARSIWLFCRLPPMSRRSYLPLPIVRAFIRSSRTTTPSADFCAAVREPRDPLSGDSATRRRPPEVSLASFNARPPNLQPRRLMDMDFVAFSPLVPS